MSSPSSPVVLATCLLCLLSAAEAFAPPTSLQFALVGSSSSSRVSSSLMELAAKKKKGKKRGGQGFGKEEEAAAPVATAVREEPAASSSEATAVSSPFLQSVEQGGSSAIPTQQDDMSPEDRAKALLRQKYGMKTLEEERLSQQQQEQLRAQRQKFEELKQRAEEDDFDIISLVPPSVLQGIFTLLKAGIGLVGTTFLLSGLAITAEAWSKATQNPLPDDVDNFIVTIVEPNFTTQLLVLLGCSVTLGVLAAAQLGSKSAQYREE